MRETRNADMCNPDDQHGLKRSDAHEVAEVLCRMQGMKSKSAETQQPWNRSPLYNSRLIRLRHEITGPIDLVGTDGIFLLLCCRYNEWASIIK